MPTPLDWIDDALGDLDRRDLRRSRVERQARQSDGRIEIEGQWLVNFGSNDYLGLAADPSVIAAMHEALDAEGWGAAASPLVTGRTSLHATLERELAAFEGTQAALLFPTGYAANVGTITALVGKGDAIFSDELNHASIIDGCRLSGAQVWKYRHRDSDHVRVLLSHLGSCRRRLIVTDSVFSMHGDLADLPALVDLASEHRAMLLVDEAHATGVFGADGRGLSEQMGVEREVAIRVGTLSKALGSVGGFVAGSQRLIEWLVNRARTYIFSTAMPAAASAAARAALSIVRDEPKRRQRLLESAASLRARLMELALISPAPPSQIISMVLGEPDRALRVAGDMRRRGFFVPAIRPPSVPEGQSLLRISVTASHTEQQIDDLVAALAEVAR
jgi:8-amino-7-oxononanoate synthase